jgi:transcriptional regulator with XRE-family HTH domain
MTPKGGRTMPLSASQLIGSADTSGDAVRLLRAAKGLTQADIVARSEGTIGADQISLIERGKRPMTSKQCTAIARALNLTDAQEAQLMLMALIDRAPERLKPTLRQARLRIALAPVEAFLMACPPDRIEALIATMEAVADVWPKVKARGKSPQNPAVASPRPNGASRGGTEHGI